ncbi:hypothetical protein PQX77_005180 [Marasmius sp. AFHP31]|nr:hypothetical protein PQX77_005180 [Marasmius sp. AFHP31]
MAPFFSLPHVEPCLKRVRALFGGTFIADSRKAKLVWEHPRYPYIYFPTEEVPQKYLKSGSGDKNTFDVVVGSRKAEGAVKVFEGDSKLSGLLKIDFAAMDGWFEEDEQIFVHPKDPYKGIADYYHVQTSPDKTPTKNIVWWYRNPNLECAAINGFAAFYDEKVDVWVDGEKQTRPQTPFA